MMDVFDWYLIEKKKKIIKVGIKDARYTYKYLMGLVGWLVHMGDNPWRL